jgi:hypothetical protein
MYAAKALSLIFKDTIVQTHTKKQLILESMAKKNGLMKRNAEMQATWLNMLPGEGQYHPYQHIKHWIPIQPTFNKSFL